MRRSILSALTFLAGFGVTAAQSQDASQWAGFYAGATYSTGTADQEYNGGFPFELEGNGLGVMVGYNYATGPWVIGGEIAYSKVEIGQPDGNPYYFESFLDLKARAGYAMNNIYFYGIVGATRTQWYEDPDGGFDGNGLLYGVGVDVLVSPNIFVGAELVRRDVTSDWNTSGDTFDADVNTWSVRVGYKF